MGAPIDQDDGRCRKDGVFLCTIGPQETDKGKNQDGQLECKKDDGFGRGFSDVPEHRSGNHYFAEDLTRFFSNILKGAAHKDVIPFDFFKTLGT